MGVRFILGRAGSGKTRWCLDAIVARLEKPEDNGRLIFVVPEQASLQAERALAARAPGFGFTRASVLSFSRLAHLASSAAAGPAEIGSGARRLVLRRIAVENADQLRTLRGAIGKDGFFGELDSVIETLLRENIAPDQLRTAAARLDDPGRLNDVIMLYERYRDWLGSDRLDAAARLALVRARLDRLDWLRGASIWVDGFAGFTGQELETLVALARATRTVAVTLLLDPASAAVTDRTRQPDATGLFHRTELTLQRLWRHFEEAGVGVEPPLMLPHAPPPRFGASPELARLESSLASAPGDASPTAQPPAPPPVCVAVYACTSAREELRFAANWIRTQIAQSHGRLRFHDFAVIARDIVPYAALVAEVFDEFELPYFLDQRRPLRSHALYRFTAALLAAAASDLDVESATQLLRTRLLPVDREACEQLECLILRHSLCGASAWSRPQWTLEDEPAPIAAFPEARARIAAGVQALVGVVGEQRCTGRDFATTLWKSLDALGVAGALAGWIDAARSAGRHEAAELHRLAWDALVGRLDEIVTELDDCELTGTQWPQLLIAGLGDVTLGLAPSLLDQVLVSAIERSRHPDVKCAWVVGFNEGRFPAHPGADRLIPTRDREQLAAAGLDALRPAREDAFGERLLAYIALTRPSERLVISFAASDAEGVALQPSALLADVLSALPGLTVRKSPSDEPPTTLAALARQHLMARGDPGQARLLGRTKRMLELCRSDSTSAVRLDWLLRGLRYSNTPDAIEPVARWRGGVSQVETYIDCPFKHFARYRLRLDPVRRPKPASWNLGDLAHDLLATVTRTAMKRPGGVRAIPPEAWAALVDQVLDELCRAWPADVPERRPAFATLVLTLRARLHALVLAHAARWRCGAFEPTLVEATLGQALPLLEIDAGGGRRMQIDGRVDRIDIARAERETVALVYDYKSTGESGFRRPYLAGQPLQLATYLLAARGLRDGERPVTPAGVLIAPLYPSHDMWERGYFAGADEDQKRMFEFRPGGVFSEAAARLLDLNLSDKVSPVANIQLRKDGGFQKNCGVRPVHEITALLENTERTLAFAGEGLTGGSIDISPLVENDSRACDHCEFQSVCRFDPVYNRTRDAERTLPQVARAPVEAAGDAE